MSAEDRLFGTDGIRGKANNGVVNPFVIPKIGAAVGTVFSRGKENHRYRALVGKDTRLSNYMIESSIISGLVSVGMDVFQTGPLPTPAVAYLTESMRADVGIMLTASHNAYEDNGIKLFGPDGFKLSKENEREIEKLVFSDSSELSNCLARGAHMGRARRINGAQDRYIDFVKRSVPEVNLEDLRVVIDCAHGAAYQVAPQILRELGVEVFTIGTDPDGVNINAECGSTHPETLAKEVLKYRADLGIALDGDGDRVTLVDEAGRIIHGDQVLALLASSWKKEGRLQKPVVVGTVMSNLGLERYLKSLKIKLERTDVGDQHILRRMREGGYGIGGEPSGHIILSDYTKTGDGLVAGLQTLSVIKRMDVKASLALKQFDMVPQITENVPIKGNNGNVLENSRVKQVVKEAKDSLGSGSRLVVRASGTEPVIRIMAEGSEIAKLGQMVRVLADVIKSESAFT